MNKNQECAICEKYLLPEHTNKIKVFKKEVCKSCAREIVREYVTKF